MKPEPESGSDIFPKDNPGPDNAKLLRPSMDRLSYNALQMKGQNPDADRELRLALDHLWIAITLYEDMR